MGLFMVVKLVPDILDRLDIFILEIEELEVPAVSFNAEKLSFFFLLCYFTEFVHISIYLTETKMR